MDGLELCQCLLDRKVTYPIIMTSSCDKTEQWVHEFANQGLNVSFLPFPCNCASLRNLMEMALKIRCEGIENPVEIVPQSRRTHIPRIVILDDEPTACDAIRMMLQLALPNAEILTFTNVEAALEELEREDPDLFTMDFQHPGMKGDKLLQLLAKRKVKYPVFVISAWGGMIEQELLKPVAQGLNVTLLPKPFTHEQLRLLLSKHLDPGKGLKLPKGAP
jgi:DNA-binding NtrC family response regulator